MKIAFFPEDGPEHPSSRIRCIELAKAVQGLGHEVHIRPGATYPKLSKDPRVLVGRLRRRAQDFRDLRDADVWFFHRGGRQIGLSWLVSRERRRARHNGRRARGGDSAGSMGPPDPAGPPVLPAMVYDYDDATYHTAPRETHRLLGMADLVLGGNDHLVAYAQSRGTHAEWFPTPLVTAAYSPAGNPPAMQRNDPPVVGWIGSRSNVKYLANAAAGLAAAHHEHPFTLHVVSDFRAPIDVPVPPDVPVERVQWTLDGAARAVARFDVGIMPLSTSEWEKGKCGFKVLEYFAAGAAAIATDRGDSARLMAGNTRGWLVDADNRDWADALTGALSDPKEAARRAAAGQQYCRETHDIAKVAKRLEQRLLALVAGRNGRA